MESHAKTSCQLSLQSCPLRHEIAIRVYLVHAIVFRVHLVHGVVLNFIPPVVRKATFLINSLSLSFSPSLLLSLSLSLSLLDHRPQSWVRGIGFGC